MTATYPQAIDDMFKTFNDAWQAGAAAVVGSIPTVYWHGVESSVNPPTNVYWVRVSTQTVLERQTTFKSGIAPSENRRYTAQGLLFIQLFCPMSDSQSMDRGRRLAVLARDAFRGAETVNGVWFRNARINELPPEENSYRFNVVVEYVFDDLG